MRRDAQFRSASLPGFSKEGPADAGDEQGREAVGQLPFVADVGDGERGQHGEPGECYDRDQGCWDDLGDAGQAHLWTR